MLTRIADDEGLPQVDDVLAVGVGKRCFSPGPPGLGESYGALEELSVLVDQGDQRDRTIEDPRSQAGEAFEAFLCRRIQQPRGSHGGQPEGVSDRGRRRHLGPSIGLAVPGAGPMRERQLRSLVR
jgi:hypothetical protein